ncbi:trypsin-like peptidase domain-containing protein [Chamaesiphon sp. OTE_8_metabat_110]|uniref:trypsin-like peptidase domain-containing protein n=2 Tax=unclassified Chamaesiphon TaxID=2620921 RepID=UPI00286A4BB8|nr:trypsin-like peptidase domain-containing protein [Chamaesiphon sp. OTE_8_metabat_110]
MGIRHRKFSIGTLLVIVGSLTGAVLGNYLWQQQRSQLPLQTTAAALNPPPGATLPIFSQAIQTDNDNFITTVVAKVSPAVVKVDATESVSQNPTSDRSIDKSTTADSARRTLRERTEKGTGSGLILSADGRIVTNAHVVDGTDRVKVTLQNGRVLAGKVVGIDRVTDVAVLKVAAKDLPTVKLGDSERLLPGEWAIAIGNPLGLDNTVTVGIVSATGRSSSQVGVPDKRVSFIQTDAAINPGNSGGPLLNGRGEAIGITTATRADAQGVGFAIPMRTVTRITTQLFATGKVRHPYLGVQMIPLTAELQAGIAKEPSLRSKLTAKRGAIVTEVVAGSPAETAGILPGDVIIQVAGRPISTPSDVQQQVEASTIGENLKLQLDRQGRVRSLEIKPDLFPPTAADFEPGR